MRDKTPESESSGEANEACNGYVQYVLKIICLEMIISFPVDI